MAGDRIYDVAVVGAGPAGSLAAHAAATAGASVLLLDRAAFPRYKTCGGGLIGVSLAALPDGFEAPVRQRVEVCDFTHRGSRFRRRRDPAGVVTLVDRAELDAALAAHAVAAGAEFRQRVTVTGFTVTGLADDGLADDRFDDGLADDGGVLEVATNHGPIRARTLIGADGSASRIGRALGVRARQVDLGLEDEVVPPADVDWSGRIHLDWGEQPGSYGWVFPKGDRLTVGVIAAKGDPEGAKAYLARFKRQVGLAHAEVAHSSGHLTRCREPDSPLGAGRVYLAGDAAALLEPWTREGISFALRSGALAGRHAAAGADASTYAAAVTATLGAEMRAGERCLAAFERRPGAIHRLLTGPEVGWRSFTRLTRGETTLDRALRHRVVRLAVSALSK